jgi:ketosteroid isomerase-like protein
VIRRFALLLLALLAVPLAGSVDAQEGSGADAHLDLPKRQPVKMSFYQEATGTNAHIDEIKKAVLEMGKEQHEALRRKDAAGVLATMAENWAYSNERGQTYSREQWVAERIGGSLAFPYNQHVDVEWHVFGDNTVVETGRSNSTLVLKGKASHGPRRETAVYAKVSGKWVLASLHVGFIPAEQRDFTFPAGALPEGVTTADPSTPPPPKRDLKMAGYQETTGLDEKVEEIKAEILKVIKARSEAVKNKDAAAFLATLAEDWGYSNERGQTFPREQWADDFMTRNFHTPFAEHVDVEWHVFGDNTVVETGRSNSILVYKGKVSHGPRRETAVYAKVNGKWVLASLHVGFIPPEQKDFTFPPGAVPK